MILIVCSIIITACSSETISEESFLAYKNLYCNNLIGDNSQIGLLERSSETIVSSDEKDKYENYINQLKNISFPSKYNEHISQTISTLQKKIELGEKYKEAINKFDVKYPNVSLFFPCDNAENCVEGTEDAVEYHNNLFSPIEDDQRDYNSKLLLEHDKIYLLVKEDLNIQDQQFACGENEANIRLLFENQ